MTSGRSASGGQASLRVLQLSHSVGMIQVGMVLRTITARRIFSNVVVPFFVTKSAISSDLDTASTMSV